MTTVSTKSGRIIKVVSREEEKSTLTESDNEMDERAVEVNCPLCQGHFELV